MATPAAPAAPAAPAPAAAKVPVDGAWTSSMLDVMDNPMTCLLGYCCPCILYGQTAEKVQGGDCVMHALKFYLYSCCCACGLVSGPTRRAIREAYHLPASPEWLKDQGDNADCLTGTIPCVACFAGCQDNREVESRGVVASAPLKPLDFDWAPTPLSMVKN